MAGRAGRPLIHRLAEKFVVGDGCWEWQAAKNAAGYGLVSLQGRSRLAHRVLYELLIDTPPVGTELDHLCRNRACVRPDHLDPVTHLENLRRGIGRSSALTHCKRGHPFDEANTYRYMQRGYEVRGCRACRQAVRRRYR